MTQKTGFLFVVATEAKRKIGEILKEGGEKK